MDLTGLINSALPALIALIRAERARTNPGEPPLTDQQVFASLHDWVMATVATDDALAADIRRRHPEL